MTKRAEQRLGEKNGKKQESGKKKAKGEERGRCATAVDSGGSEASTTARRIVVSPCHFSIFFSFSHRTRLNTVDEGKTTEPCFSLSFELDIRQSRQKIAKMCHMDREEGRSGPIKIEARTKISFCLVAK